MLSHPIPKCLACGSEVVEPGTLAGMGPPMFRPDKKGHEVGDTARALACLDCGHISFWLKRFDLSGLRKARDAGRLKER